MGRFVNLGWTLLLNSSYEPLAVINWKRAITLVVLEKVEVLSFYEDRVIHTVSMSFRLPSIVRLKSYIRRHLFQIKFSRQNIYIRDEYRCQYCGERYPENQLTFDHVVPRSKGGRTTWENIVTCCKDCNRKKGNRAPEEVGMKLLRKPRRPPKVAQLVIQLRKISPPEEWKDFIGGIKKVEF